MFLFVFYLQYVGWLVKKAHTPMVELVIGTF